MFGIGILGIVVSLALLFVVVTLVVQVARFATPTGVATPDPVVASEWRRVLSVRLAGLLAGLVLGGVTFSLGRLGRGPMLSLAVFGLCVLVGTAVGETVVRPRVRPGVRTASLAPRRVRDYLPPTTPVVGFLVIALAALLVLTTVTADGDDLGRARALSCVGEVSSSSRTPYPGSFYSVPLAIMVLLVVATAVVAARQVVARPRGMAESDADDDRLRRSSLDVVVTATGIATAAPLAGIALIAGGSLTNLASRQPTCAPGWYHAAGVGLVLLAFLALCCCSALLGRLLLVRGPVVRAATS